MSPSVVYLSAATGALVSIFDQAEKCDCAIAWADSGMSCQGEVIPPEGEADSNQMSDEEEDRAVDPPASECLAATSGSEASQLAARMRSLNAQANRDGSRAGEVYCSPKSRHLGLVNYA